MNCCRCGAEIEDDSSFCRKCGGKQGGAGAGAPGPASCPICGRKVKPSKTFSCPQCGRDDLCKKHLDRTANTCTDCLPVELTLGERGHSLTGRDVRLLEAAFEEARSGLDAADARLCTETSALELLGRIRSEVHSGRKYLADWADLNRRADSEGWTSPRYVRAICELERMEGPPGYEDRMQSYERVLAAVKEAVSRQAALAEPEPEKLAFLINELYSELADFVGC